MVPPFLGLCACWALATPAPSRANAAKAETSVRIDISP
jgi:hypothetical protein